MNGYGTGMGDITIQKYGNGYGLKLSCNSGAGTDEIKIGSTGTDIRTRTSQYLPVAMRFTFENLKI